MGQFSRKDYPARICAHDRNARGFGTRVELEPVRVGCACRYRALVEPNGEGIAPKDGHVPRVQQLSRPRFVARVERLAAA